MMKSRVDADVEISAIEALTNANLEVDGALNSIRDKRVCTEVCENEPDAKIISGKWVL